MRFLVFIFYKIEKIKQIAYDISMLIVDFIKKNCFLFLFRLFHIDSIINT
jgi:hypothetical protein